jgi:hypothetical protein
MKKSCYSDSQIIGILRQTAAGNIKIQFVFFIFSMIVGGYLTTAVAGNHFAPPTTSRMLPNCVAAVALFEGQAQTTKTFVAAVECVAFVQASSLAFQYTNLILVSAKKKSPLAAPVISAILRSAYYCLGDDEINNLQRIKIWLKWVKNHPEKLHFTPSYAFVKAMKEAFPCRG